MSRTQSITHLKHAETDQVWYAAKRIARLSPGITLLATGLAWVTYTCDPPISNWPWIIGVLIALLCCGGPLLVAFANRGTNSLRAFGVVTSFGFFVLYYFFGIFGYFIYFVFSPMPAFMRWPGSVGGIALTAYWVVMARMSVRHTIEKTPFVAKVFVDDGERYTYSIAQAMKLYERFNSERSPFPKILMYVVMGIAPFYLILSRLLSETFGANGVLLFMAILGMPVSLWFAGVLVRTYLIMVDLPGRLKRQSGKPVVVVE